MLRGGDLLQEVHRVGPAWSKVRPLIYGCGMEKAPAGESTGS